MEGAPHWNMDIGYWQQFHIGNISRTRRPCEASWGASTLPLFEENRIHHGLAEGV